MNEKILNIINKIKENKKYIIIFIGIVILIFIVIFTVGKIRQIQKENSIPMKDRYIAPPTPTITKVAPDIPVSIATSTNKASTNKTSSTTKTKNTKVKK